MCTLTYIPTNEGFVLTSNRDEHESRGETQFVTQEDEKGNVLYFSKDPKAGGTWIAVSNNGTITVLLNGADTKHKYKPPYERSRGLVLLDSFEYKSFVEFVDSTSFEGVEPFTMLNFNAVRKNVLGVQWNGVTKHGKKFLTDKPLIWSSAQLYTPLVVKDREDWFKGWLQKGSTLSSDVLNFHLFGGKGSAANNFNMKRENGLKTVSVSQVIVNLEGISFLHKNLLTGKLDEVKN